MSTITSDELKQVVLESLEDARATSKHIGQHKVGQAYINAKIQMLEHLLLFVHKHEKENTMDANKLKLELEGENTSYKDLITHKKGGKIIPAILELATKLKPGDKPIPINPEAMTWSHFYGVVYKLKQENLLSPEYGAAKRGSKYYLIRYAPEDLKTAKKPKN